ncbi:SDR family oxidoreductase [Phreatobacter aquaticus]|uniref:SDR family oxidoreductase n=1 Tax=Phreatobacter aquaticus TaxID=2570229 RepID=A0A4D7QUS0_9HYPH|nr:SDR family oxidoreductase [Phreatobacter aquaticus]QCK87712.1 SDR family oxidoreductase [Phreatobacter aquaticus]
MPVGSPILPLALLQNDGCAVVVGSQGAIGGALLARLAVGARPGSIIGLHRASSPPLDLLDEASIARTASHVASIGMPVRLVIDATGFLHGGGFLPEKALNQIDPVHMARAFAINAIGPALLMKHLLPLLSPDGRSVFATLSAKVGSIGDNQLGGWYAYRASKAALNQLVHTAAIELKRRKPQAICVALHPGTVDSGLSQPFGKAGLDVQTPDQAAERLLAVIDGLTPAQSGGFFDYRGEVLPW